MKSATDRLEAIPKAAETPTTITSEIADTAAAANAGVHVEELQQTKEFAGFSVSSQPVAHFDHSVIHRIVHLLVLSWTSIGGLRPPKPPCCLGGLRPSEPPPLIKRHMSLVEHNTCTMIMVHTYALIIGHACTMITLSYVHVLCS